MSSISGRYRECVRQTGVLEWNKHPRLTLQNGKLLSGRIVGHYLQKKGLGFDGLKASCISMTSS